MKLTNELKALQSQLEGYSWKLETNPKYNQKGYWNIGTLDELGIPDHGCIIEGVVQMDIDDQNQLALEANMKLMVLLRNNLTKIINALDHDH